MQIPRARPPLCTRIPLAVAIAVTLDLIVYLFYRCHPDTYDRFVYPLDDSYIHLAIARNLALHGVWGVTRHAFGSASSSPLWSALLGVGFKIAGVREWLPLAYGAVLAVGVLIVIDVIVRQEGLPAWANAGLLLLVALGAPLPMLVISGMEHVLQIFVDVLFLYVAAKWVMKTEPGRVGPDFGEPSRTVGPEVRNAPAALEGRHAPAPSSSDGVHRRQFAVLLLLAALVCAARYEGLFLIVATALALLVRRRWAAAVMVVLAGFVPVALFAFVSIRHGGMWLPNSVLLKGEHPNFHGLARIVSTLGREAMHKLMNVPPLFSLMLAGLMVLMLWRPQEKQGSAGGAIGRTMLFITALTALAHVQFAQAGIYFRYEGYLIVLLLVSLAVAFAHDRFSLRLSANLDDLIRVGIALLVLAVALTPLVERARDSLRLTPIASRNILEQQIQFARFLHRYYDSDHVELNDIGAASFYTDIHLLDFVGLDGTEVAKRILKGRWTTEAIDDMSRQKKVRIVIAYETWLERFGEGAPKEWIPAATWQIQKNYICGSDTVTFYAMDRAEADALRSHLREFKAELSSFVIVSFR